MFVTFKDKIVVLNQCIVLVDSLDCLENFIFFYFFLNHCTFKIKFENLRPSYCCFIKHFEIQTLGNFA